MKVLFLSDVPRAGRKNEVKDVSRGYALNFLVPNGLAKTVSDSEERELKKRIEEADKIKREEAKSLSDKLGKAENKKIVIAAKANDLGHLFMSVSKSDILKALKRDAGIELRENQIEIEDTIKSTGKFKIPVNIGGAKSSITVAVEPENS